MNIKSGPQPFVCTPFVHQVPSFVLNPFQSYCNLPWVGLETFWHHPIENLNSNPSIRLCFWQCNEVLLLCTPQKYNTESRGEYSQTRRMRTASAVYRSSSMEILRSLADTAEHKNGVHFVRCMRATLTDEPLGFQPEVVRQQLKALSVVETVCARQEGYSCRISFHEFIQRYYCMMIDDYGVPKIYLLMKLTKVLWFKN